MECDIEALLVFKLEFGYFMGEKQENKEIRVYI
jgi:hypothetical protein